MSKKRQQRGKKTRKKRAPQAPSRRGTPRAGKGPDPIKSMLLGALIFALIAGFFLFPIKGDTPFNHLVKALSSDDATPRGKSQSPALPARPRIASDAPTAPPTERLSRKEQQALDRLVAEQTR